MKIICYLNKFNDGGAERAMSALANGLHRLGHDVTVVTDYSTPNEYALDTGIGRIVLDGELSTVTAKGRFTRTLRRIFALRGLCKAQKTDIVISFIEDVNSRALLATRGLKTKNLISVRIDPKRLLTKKRKRAQIKLLYPMADGCVYQTEDARQSMPENLHKKSRVIFNPVSDRFYSTQGQPLTQKKVVTCGRLTKQKRFDVLIDAFSKVCDQFPEYTLDIYGVGLDKEKLQKQIDELGKCEQIRLMGRCEDVPNTIKDASLFVLSSDYEGLPNALMEAMALSLPVVSTDCGGGGARALIENGVDGMIVPVGDPDALAQAIRENLADPASAIERGEKAGAKAKNFCIDQIVIQWEAYIKQIVEG